MNKKRNIITLICVALILITGATIYASVSQTITEEEALQILLGHDLELNESIGNFSILGSDYNGMVKINGKESYKFSFMEKGESGHIAHNFAVSVDGRNVYIYDVVNNEYKKIE